MGIQVPLKGHSTVHFSSDVYCVKVKDRVPSKENMRWRAPDQEVDQRGRGKRLCRKIAKHII